MGICTPNEAGTDPEEECGEFTCDGSAVVGDGTSACHAQCAEEQYLVQCKPGFHCDEEVCIPDLSAGSECDEDTDCVSGACRADWDGDGAYCADSATSCVDEDGGDILFPASGRVECDGGESGYRVCQAGLWVPAMPEDPVWCGAAVCADGCGYVKEEDNLCVSGAEKGVDGGCEFEDLEQGFECVDCGDFTAVAGGCNSELADCSVACGSVCGEGDQEVTDTDVCWEDTNGDVWRRVDICGVKDGACGWSDDLHESDTLFAECGNLDCVEGACLADCEGDDSKCNDGHFCGPDGNCHDGSNVAPWEASGDYFVLTKDDGTYFDGSDCPGNFFGTNETTAEGVPFRVGPHTNGGNMAGLTADKEVPSPYGSWLVEHVHYIFPGGRCSSQPLKVTFAYTDGSAAETGQASIPHDCGSGGNWSGENYEIKHQGTYGGPCCDHWYFGRFSNPNPAKAVASFKAYYSDGCGGSYNGQLWACTID